MYFVYILFEVTVTHYGTALHRKLYLLMISNIVCVKATLLAHKIHSVGSIRELYVFPWSRASHRAMYVYICVIMKQRYYKNYLETSRTLLIV